MDELHYQLDLLTAMNQKLAVNEKMLRMICGTSTNAFLYYNFLECRLEVLGCFNKIFDFPINVISDFQNILEEIKKEFVTQARETIFAEEKKMENANVECCLQDGKTWLEFDVTVTYGQRGEPIEKIIRIRDISKYKKQNEELSYLAYYDTMTGLYNRNYFVSVLSAWVRKAEEENTLISVMCIDIDDFKKVNDGMGLVYGDELVQLLADFLRKYENENIIISHVNNDEFYIAIYDIL